MKDRIKLEYVTKDGMHVGSIDREEFLQNIHSDITVAVMGCVVNGPGEAREADIGIAGGIKEGLLFKKGKIIKKVPQEEIVKVLKQEILKMV